MKLKPDWLEPLLDELIASRPRLHHALLLVGPEGAGKEWLARELAAALLCESPGSSGRACGACASCRWVDQESHPDFRIVRPAADEPETAEAERPSGGARASKPSRDIRIEQVRALAGFVETASHRGGEKIVLISPADSMNSAAANALLKTLEEPSRSTRFLLVSSHPDRLAATVRSRCRRVPVSLPDRKTAREWVSRATGAEARKVDAWLAYCAGAPLRAYRMSQSEDGQVLEALVEVMMRLPGEPLGSAESLAALEPRSWVPALQAWCVDLARCAAGSPPVRYPLQSDTLRALAARIDIARLWRFDSWLRDLSKVSGHPLNPRLLAEDACLRYQSEHARARHVLDTG